MATFLYLSYHLILLVFAGSIEKSDVIRFAIMFNMKA